MYRTGNGQSHTLTAAMGLSQAFIGLITPNYVADIINKNPRVTNELKRCREFNLFVVLLYFDTLTDADREFADTFFKSYHVIRKYDGVPYKPEEFGAWMKNHLEELIQTIIQSIENPKPSFG